MSAAVEKEHDGGWFTRVFMDPMTEYTTFCRYEILHVALGPIFAYLYDEAEKMMRATGQHTEGLE